jgi:hypothetical protein
VPVAVMVSKPALPVRVLLPFPLAAIVSLPGPPVTVLLPSPLTVMASSYADPVMVSFPPPPVIVLPEPALVQSMVSLAEVPVTVVAV